MITEKNLIYLGFEKQNVTIEESGDYPYYYYTLEIGSDYEPFCLITNEIEIDKPIIVKIFNYDSFEFTSFVKLEVFINFLIGSIKCKGIKREGESCTLNNECTYPNCKN